MLARKGILLTTYGTLLHNAAELALHRGPCTATSRPVVWDWVFLDEVCLDNKLR